MNVIILSTEPSSTRVPFVFSIFISCRANLKHGSFTFMGRMDYPKIAPKLSPIKSRFAVGSADAFTAGYAQSELMVANKGFMRVQFLKPNQRLPLPLVSSLLGLLPQIENQ
jgi:hypothetical protein